MKSDRKLYLTRDRSKVVEKGDVAGVTLLVAQGVAIDAATARKYGLTSVDGKVVLPAEEPEATEPAEAEEAAEVEEVEEEVKEKPKARGRAAKPKAAKK